MESQNSNLTNKNKCIDYRKLISLFFNKNTYIDKIMFFLLYLTIYILYKSNSNKRKGKINGHKAFYEILNKYCNIEAVNGRFGRKIVTDICPNCNKNLKLKKHEEKETDTALSINILYDALTNKDIDTIVIISSDTDYIPIIKMILEKTDKKIKVLFPINSRINKEFSKIQIIRLKK
nr:NYN domain-containing protein [uncultured Brachyspira sp.]